MPALALPFVPQAVPAKMPADACATDFIEDFCLRKCLRHLQPGGDMCCRSTSS
jgi:hypothetical protein